MIKYNMQSILVVEDKDSMAQMLRESLQAEGYLVEVASDGEAGIQKIRSEHFDLMLTDLRLPIKDGMQVLKAAREETPLSPVVVMTAHGSVETAVEAMKEGAYDFITKPFNVDHLLMIIKRALDTRRIATENLLLKEEFSSMIGVPVIIGKSKALMDVAEKVKRAAPTKTTILIHGESGTGKELFARAVHFLSGRKDSPYMPINCAAIPHELLEAELFGFEKGAFTGAQARKLGKFELAHKGTVFLDEIGELDMSLQAKLLRVIQEGELERIGGVKAIPIDVRVVAASNKDLEKAVQEGSFREDLYYRLNVFPLHIPPLRARAEDVALLADYFIKKYTADLKRGPKSISPEAMAMLSANTWKGNIRELQNTIERAIILCDASEIGPDHLSFGTQGATDAALAGLPMEGPLEDTVRQAVKMVETARIKKELKGSGGNKTKAAAALQVSYKTLLTKIKDYNIVQED